MKFMIVPLTTFLVSFFGFFSCYATHHDFNGFYAGLAGGVVNHKVKNRLFASGRYPAANAPENLVDTESQDIYRTKPWGEIFGGWGRPCSCFYWGGRIGVNFSDFNVKFNIDTVRLDPNDEGNVFIDTSIKTRTRSAEFTYDFKPGLIFGSKTMLFGIVGGALNKQTVKVDSHFIFSRQAGNLNANTTLVFQKNKIASAWRLGLGLEHMISPCWSIQASYVYTRYWELRGNRVITTPIPNSPQSTTQAVDFRARPSKQVTSIGVAYYF